MKCKNCSDMNCPYRTTDAEKECEYSHVLGHEPLTFEQMKELQRMQLQHDWETLRNQAAIAAMQGILASDSPMSACSETSQESGVPLQQVLAEYAVLCADALIEKLKKE